MPVKWYRVGRGLEATDHETRKHGKRFDRYIRARFRVEGKTQVFGLGWESEWVSGEKARMIREGEKGPRRSFLDYCQGELSRLKQNAVKGLGPVTPKQERELAKAQKQARKEEEKRAITFGQYWEKHYLPYAKAGKKPQTVKAEESLHKTWVKPNVGHMKMVDLRPLHVEGVKRKMIQAGKAPRTIQLTLATARQVWNHARNNGVVTGDWPGRSVKAPRFDNRRLRFLTNDESKKLLAKIKETSQQVHDMALLSLDTGMRAGEIFALDWQNVDLTGGQIKVVDTKSGKNRVAYMTKRVKAMLEALPEQKGKVFPPRQGESIGQVSKTFMRCVDALKLNKGVRDQRNKLTFHSLRHTFASRLVQNGVDLYVVKELMGHSTLALTERYSHLRNENLLTAVKTLEPQAENEEAQEPERAEVVSIEKGVK